MEASLPQTIEETGVWLSNAEDTIRNLLIARTAIPGTFYTATLVLMGAANRTISQCRGFKAMLDQHNFTCASAILRMQLDTVLRLYGGLLFGHIGTYAQEILQDTRVSDLKTTDGKRMFDRLLVERLAAQMPWISRVYEKCSGSIHLSSRHVFLALGDVNTDGTVQFLIGPSDRNVRPELFLELAQAFAHTTALATQMIEAWYERLPDNQEFEFDAPPDDSSKN